MDYYHRTPHTQSYFNSFDKFELVSVPRGKILILCNDVSFCASFSGWWAETGRDGGRRLARLILILAEKGFSELEIPLVEFLRISSHCKHFSDDFLSILWARSKRKKIPQLPPPLRQPGMNRFQGLWKYFNNRVISRHLLAANDSRDVPWHQSKRRKQEKRFSSKEPTVGTDNVATHAFGARCSARLNCFVYFYNSKQILRSSTALYGSPFSSECVCEGTSSSARCLAKHSSSEYENWGQFGFVFVTQHSKRLNRGLMKFQRSFTTLWSRWKLLITVIVGFYWPDWWSIFEVDPRARDVHFKNLKTELIYNETGHSRAGRMHKNLALLSRLHLTKRNIPNDRLLEHFNGLQWCII